MEIIKLNLIPSGVNPVCHAKQYDEGRVIRIDLFDGLTPYVLKSGDTVSLNVRKPDNTIIDTTITATQGNTYVEFTTTEQICACVGYNLCDLTITNGAKVIGTLNFIMAIERDVLADGIPSQSVIEDLDALVAEAVEQDLGDNYYTKQETVNIIDEKITAIIDDTTPSDNKVYSSDKVDDLISNVDDDIEAISDKIDSITKTSTIQEEEKTEITPTFTVGAMIQTGAVYPSYTSFNYTQKIPVTEGEVIEAVDNSNVKAGMRWITAFNGDTVVAESGTEFDPTSYIVPSGIDGVIITVRIASNVTKIIKTSLVDKEYTNIKNLPLGYMRDAGDMQDGSILKVLDNNVKNQVVVAFSGNITTFNKLLVGQRKADNSQMESFYLEIDDTNITIHTDQPDIVLAHNLTIANDIQVLIRTENSAQTSLIRLVSSGEVFEDTTPRRWLCDKGFAVAVSDGSVLTDCALSWTSRNINTPIWIFGDSYISLYNDRWVYYLVNDGFTEGFMLNGYAGENSANSMKALRNLIDLTKPKYILWTLGMNDPDSQTAVNASWFANFNMLISICKKYNIEPIFATVPNVPSINNSFKNAIIRSSGYRFVDFSKALDPDEDGVWISGAIAQDYVHPTALGAKIAYQRLLVDFPEITTI